MSSTEPETVLKPHKDVPEMLLKLYLVNKPEQVEVAIHLEEDYGDWLRSYLTIEQARNLAKHLLSMCVLAEKKPQDPEFLATLPLK